MQSDRYSMQAFKSIRSLLTVAPFVLTMVCCDSRVDNRKVTKTEGPTVAEIRNKYESKLMSIEGIVLLSEGVCASGKPCLKIGTSVPVDQVNPNLPTEIFQVEVGIQYIGKIHAQ